MLWLSACASNTISSCPPLRIYGPATQERIVEQMQALPSADSDLQIFLLDSVALRDAVRACYAATGRPMPAPVGD